MVGIESFCKQRVDLALFALYASPLYYILCRTPKNVEIVLLNGGVFEKKTRM